MGLLVLLADAQARGPPQLSTLQRPSPQQPVPSWKVWSPLEGISAPRSSRGGQPWLRQAQMPSVWPSTLSVCLELTGRTPRPSAGFFGSRRLDFGTRLC